MSYGWEGKYRYAVILAVLPRLNWFRWATDLTKGDENPAYTPLGSMAYTPLPLPSFLCSGVFHSCIFS